METKTFDEAIANRAPLEEPPSTQATAAKNRTCRKTQNQQRKNGLTVSRNQAATTVMMLVGDACEPPLKTIISVTDTSSPGTMNARTILIPLLRVLGLILKRGFLFI